MEQCQSIAKLLDIDVTLWIKINTGSPYSKWNLIKCPFQLFSLKISGNFFDIKFIIKSYFGFFENKTIPHERNRFVLLKEVRILCYHNF